MNFVLALLIVYRNVYCSDFETNYENNFSSTKANFDKKIKSLESKILKYSALT